MNYMNGKKKDFLLQRIYEKSKIKRFFEFTLGCILVAISFNLFLSPNKLVPGGVSGLAIILNNLFGVDNALFIFISSILLLILSYFTLFLFQMRL